jgi:hypothetical protein
LSREVFPAPAVERAPSAPKLEQTLAAASQQMYSFWNQNTNAFSEPSEKTCRKNLTTQTVM